MTGNNVLLDTNVISAWLKGESAIADKIDNSAATHIPVIVLGELYYGARYSTNIQKNIANILKITLRYNVLHIDEDTASIYGIIKTALRKKGKPIPENDIWIAAIAQQHELILITRDKHFSEIDNLNTQLW
jgi:tRNA(fMet)-specific endonuclease VapC